MRTRLIFLLLIIAYSASLAQSIEIASGLVEKNRYLKAADTLQKLLTQYNKAHHVKPGGFNHSEPDQALATYRSFIGEEHVFKFKPRKPVTTYAAGTTCFTPALAYVAEQAATRQVIMVNEHHSTPKHRIFTYNLLDTLYRLGYRYLAVEALVPGNSSALNLKYPAIYTAEPNMANMLKKAVRLGYTLVAYESEDETEGNDKQPTYADNLREVNQAANLNKIFIKDPKAKVLVHAGYGHIWKRSDDDLIMMAQYFKIISGIDPLCINQSVNKMEEFGAQINAAPDMKETNVPYVVLNNKGVPRISAYDALGSYDLLVAWPVAKTVNGRKDYALAKKGTKPYLIDVANRDAGNLLQIISVKAGDDIPVDQFVVKANVKQYATALEVGNYLVQLVNMNGAIIWKRNITVR